MHADDVEERLLVHGVAFARARGIVGDARAGEVCLTAHDRGERGGPIAAVIAIIRNAHPHQQRAEVRIAQAQRAEIVRVLRDLLGGIGRVVDQNFLRDDHRIDRRAGRPRRRSAIGLHELHQVERREVAGRIVQEHVFRARVRRIDARRVLRRVPAVHRGVELHAGVAALPRSFGNFVHQVAGFQALHRLHGKARFGPPIAVADHGFHEFVGDADAVVGVLEKDRPVGFAVERRIVAGVDQRVRFLFFLRLAPDELLDVGMIRVEDHHLGRAARFAAALDDARKSVKALHEAQAGRRRGRRLRANRLLHAAWKDSCRCRSPT